MVLVSDEVNIRSSTVEIRGDKENKFQQESPEKNDKQKQQQGKSGNSKSRTAIDNDPETLLKLLLEISKKLGQQLKRAFYFIWIDLGGNKKLDSFVQWCVHHPQMAICILAAGVVSILPILLFVAFSLSTIVMTLIGFLVLEGTVLSILTMIMFGLLGAIGIASFFFVVVGVTTYFGVAHVYDMYNSKEIGFSKFKKRFANNEN